MLLLSSVPDRLFPRARPAPAQGKTTALRCCSASNSSGSVRSPSDRIRFVSRFGRAPA